MQKQLNFIRNSIVEIFNNYKFFFLVIFLVLLSYNYYLSYYSAIATSQDMQWYPSTLLWDNLNPYQEYLNGREWFLSQKPNYGHFLYILMYPLTTLEWENVKIIWAILSMLLYIIIMLLFLFKGKLSLAFVLFISVFLVAGYPLSNTIGNGQISIFIAFFTTIAWIYRKDSLIITSLALSVVFVKYSFGLPILFAFLLAGYYKQVVIAGLINLLTIFYFSVAFNISILESALLPLKVAMSTGVGPIDLMSLGRLLVDNNYIDIKISFLLIILVFLLYAGYILKNYKLLSDSAIIGSGILLSLVLFFHLGYDHTMFIISIFILKERFKASSIIIILSSILSIFLWQIGRINSLFHLDLHVSTNMGIPYTLIISILTICLSFYILYTDRNNKIDAILKNEISPL
jgi:hypothetical protein